MSKRTVRLDETGLFIRTNGANYRPGKISPYFLHHKMDDGGLRKGDRVSARFSAASGEPLVHITLPEDQEIVWGNEYLLEQEAKRRGG